MPVPPVIQMYRYVMGSGGGLGNLLKASEEFQQTVDWVRYPSDSQTPTVNADSRPDPNGGTTADQVGFTANTSARLQQTVTLSASTEYTFSVYARAVSGTVDFRMRNVTLKAAEVKTATTTGGDGGGFTRFTYTFTTGAAGSYELALQNDTNATAKDVIFWGAMLNEGGTAANYEYAAPTTGGSAPAPAYAGFGDAFGGVTAYYSLRKFTEAETLNAIRVRRSSDDTEQDIGFDANGDLDTTALTTFVNADVEKVLNGDFSNGSTNWIISNGSVTGGEYVSGTLSAYQSGIKQVPFIYTGTGTLTFDLTLNSGSLRVDDGGVTKLVTSSGAQSITLTNPSKLEFNAFNLGFDGIIDNISFIPTNVDGFVTKWYDQSGNSNDAINADASEQPLIVSGGSLTQLNSKAAINGDGTDDVLSLSTGVDLSSGYSIFHVSQVPSANTYGITLSNSAGNDRNLIFDTIYRFQLDGTNSNNNGASGNRGAQYLWSLVNDASGNLDMNRNGSAYGSQLTGLTGTFTFENIGTNIGLNSFEYFQELIVFNSDQTANLTGIESNINDHFSIYEP